MNQNQQKLYEKLLKKVNEYCLGYAAEDVIAAIDALVENYERRNHLPTPEVKAKIDSLLEPSEPLKALETIKNADTIYVGCWSDVYTKFPFECKTIEKSLKALEIIKDKKVNVRAFLKSCFYKDIDTQLNVYNSQCNDKEMMESKELTKEEYELLKEVLK